MRISTKALQNRVDRGERLVMVTCYDATFARLVEKSEVDMILIGDSLGMVIQGHEHTIPVTLDEMIYHCRAVARGCQTPHLVGDMPFGTYQAVSMKLWQMDSGSLKKDKCKASNSKAVLNGYP